MVETQMIMKKSIFILCSLLLLAGCKTGMTWEKLAVDGHRTGVTAPTADNVSEALGSVDKEKVIYTAPNGRKFKGGRTPYVAALLIDSQPEMAPVKEIIGKSARELKSHRPESELSNFAVDFVRAETERLTGLKTDVAVTNFGGIRVDMPEGDIMLDDIMSMFPFKNRLVWVELPGTELIRLFEDIAQYGPQCVSGVRMVIAEGKLESLEVGGHPVNPKKKYGVATVDFLLDGGDHLNVARGATKLVMTDVYIGDAMQAYIRSLTAEGKTIDYTTDGRVIVK